MSSADGKNYLNAKTGIASWIFTLDHKRISILYMICVLTAFLIGGVAALLVRLELLTPAGDLMSAAMYNRMFTLHGAAMVFMFIIPSVPAIYGNFVLPLMLGAKDVAFPRLNLASWWFWVIGSTCLVGAVLAGGIDTGWTFYTPYSIRTSAPVIPALAGAFILGFSSIFTGINFMATIHAMRPPQMSWFRMPLFLWAIYATALIQILATPVLGITLLLLIMERALHVGIFDPKLGGDPVLFQHFFWFYSHPAVYIMILPGMGIISEIVSTFSRKPVFGYRAVAYSSMAIAAVSFIVWAHHMFVSGQSEYSSMLFSLLTFLVGIPSAIKVFNWVATLYRGSISMATPMLYAFNFIFMFTIGGLTGLVCATLSTDIHLHDTYFIVSHFHYVMMGGTVMGLLGGIHYWWPKMFGKMYSEPLGKITAFLVFVGFNLTFLPQFVMGSLGMPRRYHAYVPEFQTLHIFSTFGSWILAAAFLTMASYLIWSLVKGERVRERNPWGGTTVEWQTATPPSEHNFDEPPVIPAEPYVFGGARH